MLTQSKMLDQILLLLLELSKSTKPSAHHMALAAQAGNDNTVLQGSMAHSNKCGGYKEQGAIVLTPVRFSIIIY
jgi:hypothetical protein